jgi:hypothetical protein
MLIIKPSTTIILGQNSPEISHWIREIRDLSIEIDIGTFNRYQQLKNDQVFVGMKISL